MMAHPTISMFEPFALGEVPTGRVEATIADALADRPLPQPPVPR
jgi:hypothetical protein